MIVPSHASGKHVSERSTIHHLFARGAFGITGLPTDETIKSIIISESDAAGFNSLKQMAFDQVAAAVPEPSTWAMMILGFAELGPHGLSQEEPADLSPRVRDLASLCNRHGCDPHHRPNPQQAS